VIPLTQWIVTLAAILLMPPLTVGVINKTKARLQNRIGAPIWQPIFNILKLMNKGECVSRTTTWLFRATASINFVLILLLAFLIPWVSFKPSLNGDDLFLIAYLLAAMRFLSILAALDTASPFGGFSASREATI
jgi:formate hydrogenlyase subunit 4